MGRVMDKDPTGRTVYLNRVRLSFADSLKDKAKSEKLGADAKESHSANFILESDKPEFESNKKAVIQALKAASREFKKPEDWWKTLWDDDPKQLCFRKGERFKNAETGEPYAGYAGNIGIAGKGPGAGERRPKLKDRHKRDVEYADIHDVAYNGTYCDAIIAFYATDKGGTSRITCSIEAIRSHQEGERMGGGGINVSDDDFEDLPDDDSFGSDDDLGGGSSSDDLTGGGGSSDDDLLG